jgi:hypothetical protein
MNQESKEKYSNSTNKTEDSLVKKEMKEEK